MNNDTLALAERIRETLDDWANVTERKMFGGICFMLNGNMLGGASSTGNLLLRVGKERHEEALAKPHATEMNFTGRSMGGFIYVEPEGFEENDDLARWLEFAAQFVRGLEPK